MIFHIEVKLALEQAMPAVVEALRRSDLYVSMSDEALASLFTDALERYVTYDPERRGHGRQDAHQRTPDSDGPDRA